MTGTQHSPRDKMARAASEFLNDLGSRARHGIHQRGFEDAARTCLDVLDKRINDLDDRSRSSRGKLDQQDQYLLTILRDVRAEMVGELDGHQEIINRP